MTMIRLVYFYSANASSKTVVGLFLSNQTMSTISSLVSRLTLILTIFMMIWMVIILIIYQQSNNVYDFLSDVKVDFDFDNLYDDFCTSFYDHCL